MKRFPIIMMAVVVCAQFATVLAGKELTDAEKDKKRQELLMQIEKAKQDKEKLLGKVESAQTTTASPEEVIARYESYLTKNCVGQVNERCADALFSVSKFYYNKSQDDFVKAQEAYEQGMIKYQKNPVGKEPVSPAPDYSKALASYKRGIKEYPTSKLVGEAYYQVGNIYYLRGEIDKSLESYNKLVEVNPTDVRAAAARYRLAEIHFSEREYTEALKHLNAINQAHLNDATREVAHFRTAEIYYNIGSFEKGAEYFGQYIDKCDRLEFPKRDLRPEAMEYLSVCFSDMDNGAQKALDYFSSKGKRTYEDTVTYAVGMKNYDHGQYEAAVLALSRAIDKFPDFEDAPRAQTNIVNCYVIRKKNEDAAKAREKLVDVYGKNGPWAQKNASNKVGIAKADLEVRKALGQIAIYYHSMAQSSKEPEKKSAWFAEALKRYEQFISMYPEDKWATYEYHYNAAEAYSTLGQFEKAAEYYDFVANADLTKYPSFKSDIDTLGLSQEEQEKAKKEKKSSPVDISQMDAGFNSIVALDTLRKIQVKNGNLTGVAAYQLPATQKFLGYVRGFQSRFPKSPNAPEVLMLAADVMYTGEDYVTTISECEKVVLQYGSDKDLFTRATKLKADAYTKSKQFDLAISTYDVLLARTEKNSEEYKKYIDLAAGALFLKADALRTNGGYPAAATAFMSVASKYPSSVVAEKAWFEAAASYETGNDGIKAAETFVALAKQFPASKLIPQAYGRAGENYVKLNKFTEAATVMELAGSTIKDTAFAIGALAKAAEYYKTAGNDTKSGDAFYLAYKLYPTAVNTPTALYNAGLAYEKAKNFQRAIDVYTILGTKYTETEFAAEGYYSIGYCYQKMERKSDMANAFVDYANKFPEPRQKQINAYLLATEAFIELKQISAAETNVSLAIKVYEKYAKKDELSSDIGAKSYYIFGELNRAKVEAIKLVGANPAAVKKQLDIKVKALKPVLESYAEAIKMGIEEWTFKSTYAIGMTYVNFASDLRDQQLFGSRDEKLAAKIQLVSGLEQYYSRAQEKLGWNIETAQKQGISNEYVRKSEIAYMEMGYRKGRLLEEVGEIFRDAPIPDGLTADEEQEYRDALDEKYLTALDAALPKFEEALNTAKAIGISRNVWVDSVKSRIEYIDPTSEAMTIQFETINEEQRVTNSVEAEVQRGLEQALSNISAVMSSGSDDSEKLAKLTEIENVAKRSILDEEEKIAKAKEQLTKLK